MVKTFLDQDFYFEDFLLLSSEGWLAMTGACRTRSMGSTVAKMILFCKSNIWSVHSIVIQLWIIVLGIVFSAILAPNSISF